MDTTKLDTRFKPCGLNADWWCRTWHVMDNIFICDNEDFEESFTIGKRIEPEDEDEDTEDTAIFTGSIDEVLKFVDENILK